MKECDIFMGVKTHSYPSYIFSEGQNKTSAHRIYAPRSSHTNYRPTTRDFFCLIHGSSLIWHRISFRELHRNGDDEDLADYAGIPCRGMESDVEGGTLPGGWKRNAEMKTHIIVMQCVFSGKYEFVQNFQIPFPQ